MLNKERAPQGIVVPRPLESKLAGCHPSESPYLSPSGFFGR